jgi:ribosome biogenesis GTPase / thiamine phosphate phosphatase
MNSLETYGWNDTWQATWETQGLEKYVPARITADHGSKYLIAIPQQQTAILSGSLAHKLTAADMPKIGDWVAIEPSVNGHSLIHAILPRHSEIVRGSAGKRNDKQVIAANVSKAFIIQPLDHDFSPERLERYLFQLADQPIDVTIILNKADQVSDAHEKQVALQNLGVEILVISALNAQDTAQIAKRISNGDTAVLLGSSGAGKSTITNQLLGEDRQATQAIRERDSKGRHTTVHRELFVLPSGGMMIDMPGIRELQLWGDYADLENAFPEIATAIRICHFPHCTHTNESGCAIMAGLVNETIDPIRYKRFLNFKAELELLEQKRGFISQRKEARTRETAKRLRARKQRADQDKYDQWD